MAIGVWGLFIFGEGGGLGHTHFGPFFPINESISEYPTDLKISLSGGGGGSRARMLLVIIIIVVVVVVVVVVDVCSIGVGVHEIPQVNTPGK